MSTALPTRSKKAQTAFALPVPQASLAVLEPQSARHWSAKQERSSQTMLALLALRVRLPVRTIPLPVTTALPTRSKKAQTAFVFRVGQIRRVALERQSVTT